MPKFLSEEIFRISTGNTISHSHTLYLSFTATKAQHHEPKRHTEHWSKEIKREL